MPTLRKILSIALSADFIGLCLLYIFLGSSPDPAGFIVHPAFTAVTVSLWCMLVLLGLVWPSAFNFKAKTLFPFLLAHAPLAVFIIAIVLAFAFERGADVSLMEGESIPVSDICRLVGVADGAGQLQLEKFEIVDHPEKPETALAYRSTVRINASETGEIQTIEVNHPLSIGPVTLYQKSWSVGVRSVRLRFGDAFFSFNDRLSIELAGGNRFLIGISGFSRGLVYRWQIQSTDGSVQKEGNFLRGQAPPELEPYKLSIESEEYVFVSLLEVRYKPFNTFLAVAAVFYTVATAAGFWLVPLIDGSRRRKK